VLVWPAHTGSLVITPSHLPRIPSITEAVLLGIARSTGVEVLEQTLLVSDLEDAEVWIISALQGIRLATAIVDGPGLRTDAARRDQWQSEWWNQAKSL
jgi:branched-subunit amino acid aminotransferase/4-amino-4-deoxychorismate lyase